MKKIPPLLHKRNVTDQKKWFKQNWKAGEDFPAEFAHLQPGRGAPSVAKAGKKAVITAAVKAHREKMSRIAYGTGGEEGVAGKRDNTRGAGPVKSIDVKSLSKELMDKYLKIAPNPNVAKAAAERRRLAGIARRDAKRARDPEPKEVDEQAANVGGIHRDPEERHHIDKRQDEFRQKSASGHRKNRKALMDTGHSTVHEGFVDHISKVQVHFHPAKGYGVTVHMHDGRQHVETHKTVNGARKKAREYVKAAGLDDYHDLTEATRLYGQDSDQAEYHKREIQRISGESGWNDAGIYNRYWKKELSGHKRELAKLLSKKKKNESVDSPSQREWGKSSLTKKYKKDTPGEEEVETEIGRSGNNELEQPAVDKKKPSPKSKKVAEGVQLDEVTPPGMEAQANKMKPGFKKRYGPDWKKALYATLWKQYNK